MDRGRYVELAKLAGPHLLGHALDAIAVGAPSGDEQRAVYVVENRDGRTCYAGQSRPIPVPGAAGRRVCEHLRDKSKAQEWRRYWVFPLRPDTPPGVINALERSVAARLGLPLRNRTWRTRATRARTHRI
jgi:hypothetical protein